MLYGGKLFEAFQEFALYFRFDHLIAPGLVKLHLSLSLKCFLLIPCDNIRFLVDILQALAVVGPVWGRLGIVIQFEDVPVRFGERARDPIILHMPIVHDLDLHLIVVLPIFVRPGIAEFVST